MRLTIPEIKKIIQDMKALDQRLRSENPLDWDRISKIDKKHTDKMKKIVNEFGLLDIERFDEDVSTAAWLLVQHAPKSEIEFMQNYLGLMKNNPEKVKLKNIAYLEDRINMYMNNPQTYGTQIISNSEGGIEFYKIKDIKNIDIYRKQIGLSSLEEYSKKFSPAVKLPDGYCL